MIYPVAGRRYSATHFKVHISSSLLLQCLQPYSQLDLLAPMAGINTKHLRTLLMEGALRYKEDTTKVRLTMYDVADVW